MRIPATPNDLLAGVEGHEFEATLEVSTGAEGDSTLRARTQAITRLVLFMHLAILSEWKAQVLLVVQDLAGHGCLGTQRRGDSSLRREEV